ncbi:MAG TPA: hypothetical protein VIH24_07790 [Candidatus Limnocylindria bacterium]
MPVTIDRRRRGVGRALRIVALIVLIASQLPFGLAPGAAAVAPPDHLVISEVVTGGASASDELIELYNPTSGPLPLEGLELIYASASGVTISRRAAWEVGGPEVPAGGHVLVANQAGLFAPIADATYASGMAATGGSVAIRILGATSSIDAAGWGTATGAWLEAVPAVAPAAGSSIERLPGGAAGSWQDTDLNAADFVERTVPEPQNLASAPTPADDPVAPTPLPTAQPPTPEPPGPDPTPPVLPTPVATPPAPATVSLAMARGLADGTTVSVEGVALTGSDFHDGGGFVADASGGIAVIVTDGEFARGTVVRLTGELDDRFSQRTLRVAGAAIEALGTGGDTSVIQRPTGAIGEADEGTLVRVVGAIAGSASLLTTGVAFDVDDGSGTARLVVGSASGIDTSEWKSGTHLDVVGVLGQRDSTGSGTTGYRLMPRDAADVRAVLQPAASQSPDPTGPQPSPIPGDPPPSADVVSIAAARAAPRNARLVVRGVVTLPSGIVDAGTAVIQDATGAIVLRLGDDVGALRSGQRVEVFGSRSTKSGMETLRVTEPIRTLGSAALPPAPSLRSGDVAEEHEARLIVVRGALVTSARRATSGSATFDIDDGSGPLKVAIGAALSADTASLRSGTWVEVRGALGQQTTGSKPHAGYRLWPANLAAVRIIAVAGDDGGGGGNDAPGGADATTPATDLGGLAEPGLAELRVGATLVVGPWAELGIGGLLWDGVSLVAIDRGSAELVARVIGTGRPPIAVELGGLVASGIEPVTNLPRVRLSAEPGDIVVRAGLHAAPRARLTPAPAWVSAIGRLDNAHGKPVLRVPGRDARLDLRCGTERLPARGIASVTGIVLADPLRMVIPCGGVRGVPRLAMGSPAIPMGPARATLAGAAVREADAGPMDSRPLAAGLLLTGALGITLGAAWHRIRGGSGPPGAGSQPGDPVTGTELDHEPPRLKLLSVPREHGP